MPLKELIHWNHKEKLTRIEEALNLFLRENVETEKDLFEWIQNETNQKKLKNCRGVGPKTLDYYKLLSGHSTLAIDRHLQNFVREAGCDVPDYVTVQKILSDSARILNKPERDLDHSIWKYMSVKSKKGRHRKNCDASSL